MKQHAVLVDVSIDQGGCFETSRATTHSDPTFEVDGITHYCVANMPGAVPVTSTYALTNATLPYVLHLADAGVARAARENPGLAAGVNVAAGKVTYQPVAEATGQPYTPLFDVLGEGAAASAQPPRARSAERRKSLQSARLRAPPVAGRRGASTARASARPATASGGLRPARSGWRTSVVDRDVPRAGDDVLDRVGDVLGLQPVDVASCCGSAPDLRAVVEDSSVATAPGSITRDRGRGARSPPGGVPR